MTTVSAANDALPFPATRDTAAAQPPTLHFAASHAVRQAKKALGRSRDLLEGKAPSTYASVDKALTASLSIPQYRRTYVQGCACATGIAGGGCCPGNAMGSAAQAGAGQAGAMSAMIPADVALGALSVWGMYSGYTVTRNAYDALQNLQRVDDAHTPQLARARLWHARVSEHETLEDTREAASATVRMYEQEKRDLRASIDEQRFNMAVPGLVQAAAATSATVATIGHLAGGCLGVIGSAAVGSVASGLFAVYGGALAVKNLREYAVARKLRGVAEGQKVTSDPALDARYAAAMNAHLQATRKNKLLTGLAWTAVFAAGVLGTLVASGVTAFAGALPVVLAVGLASGLWAMWQNSRTRYVPHMPISPHVDRAEIATAKQRAITWDHLRRQDGAIKRAVAEMRVVQRKVELLKFHGQRLFRPQCGPKAFTVLAKSVQQRRGVANLSPEALQAHYERVQLHAARTWCDAERSLLQARFAERASELEARCGELKGLVSPCCIPMTNTARAALTPGAPTEGVYTDAARALEGEALDLERAAARLVALDTLVETLAGLASHAGSLGVSRDDTWTAAQRDWVFARIQLLQLSGALSDAVSASFIKAHPAFFSQLSAPDALPLGNVYLLERSIEDFASQLAPELDGAFVHAFFNPRRVEGEMDFIVEREIRAQNAGAHVAAAAPSCDSGTCCR